MWRQKLGFSMGQSFGMSIPEAVRLVKNSGFDALSPEWQHDGSHLDYIRAARECGLELQSLHAPFGKAKDMWGSDEARGRAAVDELLNCLHVCAEHGIPIMVVHAFIGFEDHSPTPEGVSRYEEVAKEARRRGVKVALENTEGEEYLHALAQHFRGDDTVGFCWDSGHELCYNHSQDLLALYGDRLLITHLNDNLGIRDFNGKITWLDDLHLLPFDGITDWERTAERLKKARRPEILNFELGRKSKPGRHENDLYEKMTPQEYLAECYKRACRVAARMI